MKDKTPAKRESVPKVTANDLVAQSLKATFGVVPLAGPALAEVITSIIPNQRIDRIQRFAEQISHRLEGFEASLENLNENLKSEAGCSHFENCVQMASQATSQERIEYIAALFVNGVIPTTIDEERNALMARLLGNISDAEVIVLAWRSESKGMGDAPASEDHLKLLYPDRGNMATGRTDAETLNDAWMVHLEALGLVHSEGATQLGIMLLDSIGPLPSMVKGRSEPRRYAQRKKPPPTTKEIAEQVTKLLPNEREVTQRITQSVIHEIQRQIRYR